MTQKEKQGRPNDSQADEFQQDIYAQPKPNLNYGHTGQASEVASTLNAYEIKELHSQLKGFSKDEMQQITVLPPGTPLNEGTKYVDLMDDGRQVITGATGMTVGNNSYYVAKNEVDYLVWDRLIDVSNPESAGISS